MPTKSPLPKESRKQSRRSKHIKHVFLPTKQNNHHPHILKREVVVGVLALALMIEVGVFAQSTFFFNTPHNLASVLPAVVDSLTNDQRTQNGLDALTVSPLLSEAAQDKANDMAAKSYFAHVSPDGTLPWHWFGLVGYDYQYAGENLAVNFSDSDAVVTAWMNSPLHRANILKQQYTETGVGMANGTYQGKSTIFVVQFFAKPEPGAGDGVAAALPKPNLISTVAAKVQSAVADIPAPTELMTTTAAPQAQTVAQTATAQSSATQVALATTSQKQTDVLGMETENLPAPVAPKEYQRLLASPFTVSKYIFVGIAGIFALILLLGIIYRKRLPRMTATIGGLVIVILVLGFAILNQHLVSGEVVVTPHHTTTN